MVKAYENTGITSGLPVNQAVATVISNWPSSYASRADALKSFFTKPNVEWIDGQPYIDDTMGMRCVHAGNSVEEEETEVASVIRRCEKKSESYRQKRIAETRLYIRRERARAQFNRDNVEWLAVEENSKFSFTPQFTTRDLNRLPFNDMTADWRAAFKEFCDLIIYYSDEELEKRLIGKSEEAQRQEREMLEASKLTAREGLFRIGEGKRPAEQARQEAIEKLRAEAAKFGFDLTQIKPE